MTDKLLRTFRFEIQNCIKVEITAISAEEARIYLIENLSDYAHEMCNASCYVSDGEELKQ